MKRMAVTSAVLLISLTIAFSVAAAQKSDEPPLPDPMTSRADSNSGSDQETTGSTPEILRWYTAAIEPYCSLDPLSAVLNDMLAAGELKEALLLKNNQLHILIGKADLDDLSVLPCVREIMPDDRNPQLPIKSIAPSLDNGPQSQNTETDVTTNAATAGTISGVVTDEDSGLALPDIIVQVYNYPGPDTGWSPFSSTDTDVNGAYSIANLPAGTYRIGFFDWLAGTFVGEFFDDVFDLNIAFDIPVADGATVQDTDAALSRPGQIVGTVQDAVTADLLEGIEVHAFKQNLIGWEEISSSTTLVDGTYVIDDLPSGTYSVRFDDAGGTYFTQFFDGHYFLHDSDDVVVSGGAMTSAVDASLTYAGHIQGNVTAETGGAPLENIEVCALLNKDAHWEALSCDFTDSAGDYDVGNLTPGTYRVIFSDQVGDYNGEYYDDAQDLTGATDVLVSLGGTIQNVNAALSSAGHITGVVTAAGGDPLKDIRVCALSFLHLDWRSVTCDYTDAAGHYDLSRLPTGKYRVEFYDYTGKYAVEYYSNSPDVFHGFEISVVAGGVTSAINAELAEYGRIGGHVTAVVDGVSLRDIKVCAQYSGIYSELRSRCTFTAADGNYEISDLYPGNHFVNFYDYTSTYVGEYYDGAAQMQDATPVNVIGGQAVMGINAALVRYGLISGTVTAEDGGAPLTSIHVYAFIETAGGWTYSGRGDTNSNGQYEIGPLASGNYLVQYYDGTGTYMAEYFDDVLSPEHAGQVSIAPGSLSQGVDAALALAITQDVALNAGWNMISSYVQPPDPAVETLFESVENDLVLVKNGDGEIYWPAYRINQIGDWNALQGYQIYMDNPAMLRLSGAAILPAQSPISLSMGWNMVAYLGDSAAPIEQALASIENQLLLAKNAAGEVYWPALGRNDIGDMLPGQGYKLYMLESGILTYPSN